MTRITKTQKADWNSLFDIINDDCDRFNIDIGIAIIIWTTGFVEYKKGKVTLQQLQKRYQKLFE